MIQLFSSARTWGGDSAILVFPHQSERIIAPYAKPGAVLTRVDAPARSRNDATALWASRALLDDEPYLYPTLIIHAMKGTDTVVAIRVGRRYVGGDNGALAAPKRVNSTSFVPRAF